MDTNHTVNLFIHEQNGMTLTVITAPKESVFTALYTTLKTYNLPVTHDWRWIRKTAPNR